MQRTRGGSESGNAATAVIEDDGELGSFSGFGNSSVTCQPCGLV
jgi:hypothetical protein